MRLGLSFAVFCDNRIITFKTKQESQANSSAGLMRVEGNLCEPDQRADRAEDGASTALLTATACFPGGILSELQLGSVPEHAARAVTFPFDILSLNGR